MSIDLNHPNFIHGLKTQAQALGFSHLSASNLDLTQASIPFKKWLANAYHGQMQYMEKHGPLRFHPEQLVEGTQSVITVRLPYFNPEFPAQQRLEEPHKAYIAQYAHGRDYHNVIRKQLKQLGRWLTTQIPDLKFRALTDSAPLLERALSEKSGLGFFGKNTMIIDPIEGSYFFLGELLINKSLIIPSQPIANHCGRCKKCITVCPTQAIVAPYVLDARLCISYLTIEYHGAFPVHLRKPIGNRIFGCDDCQIVCPWNRFAKKTALSDFAPRNHVDDCSLLSLFSWSEAQFLKNTEGSPIRRLGYARFLRNLAIGLGNAPFDTQIVHALQKTRSDDEAVQNHIFWALEEQSAKRPPSN